MLHKPTYCCNCGDKVDRVEWHIWNSTRFCELCETDFQFDEWWPRAAIFIILIFGFSGIGFHFAGTGEERSIGTKTLASPQNGPSRDIDNRDAGKRDPGTQPAAELKTLASPQAVSAPEGGTTKPVPIQTMPVEEAPEPVYYCGAPTKKGTPCARRVKDGGRCWQHKVQPLK